MFPKKHFIKAAWTLLLLCALVGLRGAVARAGMTPACNSSWFWMQPTDLEMIRRTEF